MDIMSALRRMAETIKAYINENFISFSLRQTLTQAQKDQARKNIGIYVSPTEPPEAAEGDIWFDTSNGTFDPINQAEIALALKALDEVIGGMTE